MNVRANGLQKTLKRPGNLLNFPDKDDFMKNGY
jgi:hypothetical protein